MMADTASRVDVIADLKRAAPLATRRGRLLTGLAALVVMGLIVFGIYWALFGSHFVSTDNAYVGADTAQITPLVSAPVKQVLVKETQTVKAGDVLVELDAADARLRLSRERANAASARADFARTKLDLSRRRALAGDGAVSRDELSSAENAFATASAAVERARANVEEAELALSSMKIR